MQYSNSHLPPCIQVSLFFTLLLSACDNGVDPAVATSSMTAPELAEAKGCVACHAFTTEAGIGPGWVLPWGQPRKFADGTSLTVNEAYLRLSMQDPGLNIVEGFSNLMVQPDLSDAERETLVAFIRELSISGMEAGAR
jgi:cytochrome c oxidase subunit 2